MSKSIELSPDQAADLWRRAFDMVCDPTDWKGPIDCVVPWEMANLFMQAIEFMTGVRPNVVRQEAMAHITCVGYRMGPCGG